MILPKNVHYVNVSNYVQLLNSKYVLSREKIVKLERLSRLCVLAYIGIYLAQKVTPEGACRATKGTRRDLSTVVPAASINLLRHNKKK